MVQGRRLNNLGAQLVAGNFSIVSGVNEKLGGNDDGPNPHELVEAALAACTIITIQMYAQRKGMKLDSANVTVKIESESPEKSTFSRKIELLGALSNDEKSRLLEIADRCPIHKLLCSQITIVSELTNP